MADKDSRPKTADEETLENIEARGGHALKHAAEQVRTRNMRENERYYDSRRHRIAQKLKLEEASEKIQQQPIVGKRLRNALRERERGQVVRDIQDEYRYEPETVAADAEAQYKLSREIRASTAKERARAKSEMAIAGYKAKLARSANVSAYSSPTQIVRTAPSDPTTGSWLDNPDSLMGGMGGGSGIGEWSGMSALTPKQAPKKASRQMSRYSTPGRPVMVRQAAPEPSGPRGWFDNPEVMGMGAMQRATPTTGRPIGKPASSFMKHSGGRPTSPFMSEMMGITGGGPVKSKGGRGSTDSLTGFVNALNGVL